jgi:SAM-dependent methyltransferase
VAASADADELKERILTGFKAGKPFTPYVSTIGWPPVGAVLDFGCGVGRNFPYLTSVANAVTGFDLPPMIARCRGLSAGQGTRLVDDWAEVASERFDLVYASLVLQHIETDAVRSYLAAFATIAPAVYLLTRSDTDFGANIFELVAECGRYRAGECVEVSHDPDTHQLRVLGRTALDGARRAPAGGHYEVMLDVR